MTETADVPLPEVDAAESTTRTVNGIDLHVVAAGDPADPLVVLLHGFPEFWYGWRAVVAPLVDAGFRVLVPDQRGYNRSEKPDGISAYRRGELVRDVRGLIRSAGRESAHVVGHDWGAIVAWDLARRHPEAIDRLGIVNVPHPKVWRRTIRRNPGQLKKSWYVFFFQLPWLPEWSSRRENFALWVDALREGAQPGTFTETDIERYRGAWGRDGAPTAMLNWYRAMLRVPDAPARDRVTAPTLVIWGEQDQALVPSMAPASLDYCVDGRLETFPENSHWIIHERPETVSDLLREHLTG